MGILTKMLGTKTFLLLTLSVLGFSMPQPELRIIIHLHGVDNFQPGPAREIEVPRMRMNNPFGSPRGPRIEGGQDYSDDDADTVDEDVIPNKDVIPNEDEIPDGNVMMGEVELDKDVSGSGDQSGRTKVVEAGDDYSDQRIPAKNEARDGGQGSDYCAVDYMNLMTGKVELDEKGSGSGDQSGGTKVVEAGDDYSDQRTPKYYGAAKRDGGRWRRRGYRVPCWSPLCPVDWVS